MPRARVNPESGLTERQEKFCLAYIETGNGSEAYRRSYSAGKMKPETISKRAYELLENRIIAGRIDALRQAAAEKAVITSAEVLQIAANMVRADLRKLYNTDGSLKPPSEWPDDMIHALASVRTTEHTEQSGDDTKVVYTRDVKLADRNAAVDRLFKHFGLFEKDNAQAGNAIALAFMVPGKDKDKD